MPDVGPIFGGHFDKRKPHWIEIEGRKERKKIILQSKVKQRKQFVTVVVVVVVVVSYCCLRLAGFVCFCFLFSCFKRVRVFVRLG